MSNLDITVKEFFENIRDCEITEIEIYNYLQKITDDFNRKKLKLVLKDFDIFFYTAKEEYQGNFTNNDIEDAIKDLITKNRPIPKINIPPIPGFNNSGITNVIDVEKLLFPFEFFCCYQFQSFLLRKLNSGESKDSQKEKVEINDKVTLTEFKDIFLMPGWKKYINVLSKTYRQY